MPTRPCLYRLGRCPECGRTSKTGCTCCACSPEATRPPVVSGIGRRSSGLLRSTPFVPTEGDPVGQTAARPASPGPSAGTDGRDPRRWWMLAVLGLAQLMVILDATIVNIALPSAQQDLGFSNADRQWVVTAYSLAFGGLLLLGGRLADLFGRRRMLLIGLIGFAAASSLGGAAQGFGLLVVARAIQGSFGALLAPAALSMLTVTFTDSRERGKAFGIFGSIAGAGAAVGLLLGGVLTEYLSWRWCLFVNVPIAVVAAAGAIVLLPRSAPATNVQLDIPGAVLAVVG